MADEIKRLNYFDHQFLVEADFTDEQKYHLDMRRQHNRLLHTFGIAEGLEVEKSGDTQIKITAGTAYDRDGQEIVLTDDNATIDLSNSTQYPPGSDIYVTIEYHEEESDPSTATGVTGNTRITEEPKYEAVKTEPPSDGSVIRLANFTLESDGKVPGSIGDTFDGGMRQMISATIASEAVNTNELADEAVTMDKLATPVQNTIKTTKGIASINGVSNPDGNVDLDPGTGIDIIPDVGNKKITIETTGAQGLVSIDGVSSPGGNVDLVEGKGIKITPDGPSNSITIDNNGLVSINKVTNPGSNIDLYGGTGIKITPFYDDNVIRIDALGVLSNIRWVSIKFTNSDKDGASRSFKLPFDPKTILCIGGAKALLGTWYGGGISGYYYKSNSVVEQYCFGIYVYKNSDTNEWRSELVTETNFGDEVQATAACIFEYSNSREELFIDISYDSPQSYKATLHRSTQNFGGYSMPFTIFLKLLCIE